MAYIRAGDWEGVARLMRDSAERLIGVGARLLVCPDNTIHQAYDQAAEGLGVRWLHIAEVVADEASRRGFKQLAVLGTRYLMEGPVYPRKLKARGINHRTPTQAGRLEIDRIIFDELVYGKITDAAWQIFEAEIGALQRQGCDAVVLGCTEIPLLVTPQNSPLPVLDSTRLLARAALSAALA